MKKISAALALTAALTLGATAFAQAQPGNQTEQAGATPNSGEFSDVPAGHWATEAIQIAANCGIIVGFPDGTFRGNTAVTRYQAAAIVARLLDAIKSGDCAIEAGGGDMTVINNAIEELSADLAELGVRVQDLEDNAVTQDDLARVEDLANEALAMAEAAQGGGEGVDPEALADLQDQLEAASIAADTALAQASELQDMVDGLGGRVDDLESQLGELGAEVESQADSIAALNDLVVLLNQDVLSLQDRVAALEGGAGDVVETDWATNDDLDALREFTTLLRRDQTALSDRVGDLEARVGNLEGRVAGLESDVAGLRGNGFTISGSITLKYSVERLWGTNKATGVGGAGFDFDIDRLGFGTVFSSGDVNEDGLTTDETDWVDTNGVFTAGLSITLAFNRKTLVESSGGYNTFPADFSLTLSGDYATNAAKTDNLVNDAGGLKFTFKTLSATYSPIGGAPLTFAFGAKPGFSFSSYVLDNPDGRGPGFVATLDGAGVLPFGLKLTGAYGSHGPTWAQNSSGGTATASGAFYWGVKGEASVIPGFSGGVYFGQLGFDINSGNTNSVYGYGATFGGNLFGLVDLKGEYNIADPGTLSLGGTDGKVAAFVDAGATISIFSIGGTYRFVDAAYATVPDPVIFDAISTNDALPYKGHGFSVGAKATLFNVLTVTAFYQDQFEWYNVRSLGNSIVAGRYGNAYAQQAFGVKATLRLLGFDITGDVYNRIAPGTLFGFGVRADHDGSKADALLKNVNVSLGYNNYDVTQAANRNEIWAYADTTLTLAGISITPKAYYHSRGADNVFGGGLSASVPFLFGSKLTLGAAYDTGTVGTKVETTWASVGLAFDKFIFPNSSFSVSYAMRTDINRTGLKFGPSFASPKALGTWGTDGKGGGSLGGLYFTFGYYGLNFSYGIFSWEDFSDGPNRVDWGQGFTISYALKF